MTTIGGTDGEQSIRVQTDQMTDAETRAVTAALAEAYQVPADEVSSSFIGPSWGQDVTRQSLWGLAIFLALTSAWNSLTMLRPAERCGVQEASTAARSRAASTR